MSFTPSASDVNLLLGLLESGLSGVGARQAQATLESFQAKPEFCQLLTYVYSSATPLAQTKFPWLSYRQIAGLTLKNSIVSAHQHLGQAAVAYAATSAASTLFNDSESVIVETTCQIVSKITSLAGVEWWKSLNIDLLGMLVAMISGQNPTQVGFGLRALQYLLEDAGKKIGVACYDVLVQVANIATNHQDIRLRQKALTVMSNPFELGRELDWNVEMLSPMQQGLCNAVKGVAMSVTTILQRDGATDLQSLRGGLKLVLLLTEYMDYLFTGTADDAQVTQCVQYWIQLISEELQKQRDVEVANWACDFVSSISRQVARTAIEEQCAVAFVGSLLEPYLPTLLERLLQCMVMHPEQEKSLMEKDNHQYRDLHASRKLKRKFTEEAEDVAEHELFGNLRESASVAFEGVCLMAPATAWNTVIPHVQGKWKSTNWREQELALFALTMTCSACQTQLKTLWPQLIPELCNIAAAQTHVLVTATALQTLTQAREWVISTAPQMIPQMIDFAAKMMPSPSKTVQCAATTSVKLYLTDSCTASIDLTPLLPTLIPILHQCLAGFHTNNLALLVDCYCTVWIYLKEEAHFHQASEPFQQQTKIRGDQFFETAQKRYGHGDQNQHVHKELFDISRGLAFGFKRFMSPQNAQAAYAMCDSWFGALQTLLTWDTSDDPEMISFPLYLIWLLTQGMNYDTYAAIHPKLYGLALHLLDNPSGEIAGTCISILADAIGMMGEPGVLSVDDVVTKLIPSLNVSEHPVLAVEAAGLLSALVLTYGTDKYSSLAKAAQLLATQLRTDTFGGSTMMYLAHHLSAMLVVSPLLFPGEAVVKLLFLVAGSFNDDEHKHEGTKGLINAVQVMISQNPANSAPLARGFVKLLTSWQLNMAPELIPQASSTMRVLNQHASGEVHAALSSLHTSLHQGFLQHYRLI